ncbi:MAG: hypothetical protein H6R19_2977 [Proteobacteria bacterium]|nr:hypothetical protein [Pseudomonadota bacterium]
MQTRSTTPLLSFVLRYAAIPMFALVLSACSSLGLRNESAPAPAGKPAQAESAPAKSATSERPCRAMKSKDGSFEGCIYGNPPANAKFSKLVIGMSQYQVEKLLGHPQDLKYITNWRKAIIPFYQGTDARRLVWLYEGQGSVSFDTRGAYSDGGMVVEINYEPKIEL